MKLRFATLLALLAALALVAFPAWAQDVCQVPNNIVVNCGFETGDFTGWTQSGNLGFTFVTSDPTYVWSGTYGAQLGPVGSDGYLTQGIWGNTFSFQFRQDPAYWGLDSVVVEDVGSLGGGLNLYYVSFWLESDGGTPNDFTVLWNGVDVGPSLVDAGQFPFSNFTGYLVGVSVPEPGSLMLLGSGVLGVAGLLRRKLNF